MPPRLRRLAGPRQAPLRRRRGERVLENSDQLERFLAEVERRAYRMAAIATADPEDALDLVQEAMMVFAQRYAHSRPRPEWPPLFYRILQNKLKDWHRRRATRGRWMAWWRGAEASGERDPIDSAPDPGPDPERNALTTGATDALESALRALPERQRQAFLLRAWEGMNVAETARAMGCSAGSVKTHYFRALKGLRERLEDWA